MRRGLTLFLAGRDSPKVTQNAQHPSLNSENRLELVVTAIPHEPLLGPSDARPAK